MNGNALTAAASAIEPPGQHRVDGRIQTGERPEHAGQEPQVRLPEQVHVMDIHHHTERRQQVQDRPLPAFLACCQVDREHDGRDPGQRCCKPTSKATNALGPTWLAIASIAAAEGGYMNGKTRPSLG